MPYKFETDKTPMPESKDRRVKLTKDTKAYIATLKGSMSQRACARLYNVSRRTITFIWNPQQLQDNLDARKASGGSMQYYDKDKNTTSIREHRRYKNTVLKEG